MSMDFPELLHDLSPKFRINETKDLCPMDAANFHRILLPIAYFVTKKNTLTVQN